ncbi:rab11 family-interacting protein 4A-like [Oncorhynchus masou masou]|uniref:rab11 family-interacting protein 4A-like n=1 Tax=Oncorhynchus masou masou TaxID=90313 RepID=UPI0031842AC2
MAPSASVFKSGFQPQDNKFPMESVLPDAEQLLLFLRKLKEVFDLCDEDSDGYIRVEHFVNLGSQFGQGDEVKKLAKCLDPNAQGRINFKDFCHGVLAIKGCEGVLKTTLGARSITQRPYETDNGFQLRCCAASSYQRLSAFAASSSALGRQISSSSEEE